MYPLRHLQRFIYSFKYSLDYNYSFCSLKSDQFLSYSVSFYSGISIITIVHFNVDFCPGKSLKFKNFIHLRVCFPYISLTSISYLSSMICSSGYLFFLFTRRSLSIYARKCPLRNLIKHTSSLIIVIIFYSCHLLIYQWQKSIVCWS